MNYTAKQLRLSVGAPLLAAALLSLSLAASAQTSEVAPTTPAVAAVIPQQVRYTGALPNHAGETVEVVFRIYTGPEGGEALWSETQQVSVNRDGSYAALLGASSPAGLPQTVFSAGQARWLGVTVDRAEAARSPLTSVAYAMKAGDAETVGGLAATSLATKDDLARLVQTPLMAAPIQPQIQAADTPTGSGTTDYVPLWTSSGTLGNSNLYQAASGFMGIGTTTPGGPLQLSTAASGGANATMMLTQTSAASGNYYADIGLYNSKGLIGNLSALGAGYPSGNLFVANDVVFLGGQQNAGTNLIFLTNTSGALKFGTGGFAVSNERMRIGAAGGVSVGNSYVGTDPGAGNLIVSGKVGVGTTMPGATLEVNGTAKFDGLITFASGQTFPGGGSGTITGITTSSPLTGSGTSGSVALGLNTSALETTLNSVYAQLGASNTFADATTFSKGIISNATGTTSHAVNGAGTSGATGVYGSSDTGTGVSGLSTSGIAVYGSSNTGSAGGFSNATYKTPTVYAVNTGNTASATLPLALNASATGLGSGGAYGFGTQIGVWGDTSATNGGGYGFFAEVNDAYAAWFENNGTDAAAVYANNYAPGSSTTAPMVYEAQAVGSNAYGVYSVMTGNGAEGIYGESDGTLATGSGRSAVGVKGVASGADGNGLVGDATGTGGYGVYARASGAYDATRFAPAGVYALSDSGIGSEGFTVGQSTSYNKLQALYAAAGVWGDTSANYNTDAVAGVVGTADNNTAAFFENNSTVETLDVLNASGSGSGPTGLFKVFKASTPSGTCGIGDGDLSCTGQVKMLTTTSGARTVETYAMQSPESWMEDFGTSTMQHGHGVVQIDPAFAATVTADASYHVFLTPLGDSKGHLYVVKSGANSFEVREANGGSSSLSFDYRIVAKRRGYEAQRMVDVTDRFNAEQAQTRRRMPAANTAVASKTYVEPNMVEHPANMTRAANLPRPNLKPAGGTVAPGPPAAPARPLSQTKPLANTVVQK